MGFNTKAVQHHLPRAALAAALAFSGCSTPSNPPADVDEPLGGAPAFGVGQSARLGGASYVASGAGDTVVIATAVILAKYEATAMQRKLAEERARRAFHAMPPARKKAMQVKKVRYIAVDTQKDARFKGRKAVMIWDTKAESLVGNGVYDVQVPPPISSTAKFETFASEYVGGGT